MAGLARLTGHRRFGTRRPVSEQQPLHLPHQRTEELSSLARAGEGRDVQHKGCEKQHSGESPERASRFKPYRLLCAPRPKAVWQGRTAGPRHTCQRHLPQRRRAVGLHLLEEHAALRHVRHRQPREISPRLSPHTRMGMDERPQRHVLQGRRVAPLLPA